MDGISVDLTNTPGTYYAIAYGLSALTYIYFNRETGSRWHRSPTFWGLWALLILFMTATYNVPVVWFLPCILLALCLIFLMLYLCCRMDLTNTIYFTMLAFVLGEFAASLEWQLFYYGLTEMGLPLKMWVNLIFLLCCHGLVFGVMSMLQRRFWQGARELDVSREQLWTAVFITAIIYAVSNLSYVLKNTPFSSQFTSEIFIIRTLVDLGGAAILFGYHMTLQDAQDKREIELLQRLVRQQYENYRISEESIDLVNRKYHDLKHQIAYLKSDISEAERRAYLDEMENEVKVFEAQNRTGNHVVDAILTAKSLRAGKLGIQLAAVVDGAAMAFLPVSDICSLLGNALDNAIEGADRVKQPEERLIRLSVNQERGFLRLRVENRCAETAPLKDGALPATTKADKANHGYGLRSMQHIAQHHGGSLKIENKDGWFRLWILIPMEGRAEPAPEP